jgi:hypothetical protein
MLCTFLAGVNVVVPAWITMARKSSSASEDSPSLRHHGLGQLSITSRLTARLPFSSG